MNRVKKISRRYAIAKPEIDKLRAIRSHTRRARRAAASVQQVADFMDKMRANLEAMTAKELKKIAGEANIKGRSKMNKKQLVEAIIRGS